MSTTFSATPYDNVYFRIVRYELYCFVYDTLMWRCENEGGEKNVYGAVLSQFLFLHIFWSKLVSHSEGWIRASAGVIKYYLRTVELRVWSSLDGEELQKPNLLLTDPKVKFYCPADTRYVGLVASSKWKNDMPLQNITFWPNYIWKKYINSLNSPNNTLKLPVSFI